VHEDLGLGTLLPDVGAQIARERLVGLHPEAVHAELLDGDEVPLLGGQLAPRLRHLVGGAPLEGLGIGPVFGQGTAADADGAECQLVAGRLDDLRQEARGILREAVADGKQLHVPGCRGGGSFRFSRNQSGGCQNYCQASRDAALETCKVCSCHANNVRP
jgi:hypothetical protein